MAPGYSSTRLSFLLEKETTSAKFITYMRDPSLTDPDSKSPDKRIRSQHPPQTHEIAARAALIIGKQLIYPFMIIAILTSVLGQVPTEVSALGC